MLFLLAMVDLYGIGDAGGVGVGGGVGVDDGDDCGGGGAGICKALV